MKLSLVLLAVYLEYTSSSPALLFAGFPCQDVTVMQGRRCKEKRRAVASGQLRTGTVFQQGVVGYKEMIFGQPYWKTLSAWQCDRLLKNQAHWTSYWRS
jgi:hypothetical protein